LSHPLPPSAVYSLSLHDALPISMRVVHRPVPEAAAAAPGLRRHRIQLRCLRVPREVSCSLASVLAVALFDGHADGIAPLGPRSIVIAYLLKTEKIFQHEPGMRGAFTDPAIHDDVIFRAQARFATVQLFQFVAGTERAVVRGRL